MIKTHIEPCEDCPLRKVRERVRCIGSRGPEDARMIVIAEAPGSTELARGVPMVGPSGQLLESVLRRFDVDISDVLITNALSCRPVNLTGEIPKTFIQACHKRLIADIEQSPRDMILLLGRSALRSVTGRAGAKITAERGKVIRTPYGPAVPTFHPAAILRSPAQYRYLVEDMRYAVAIANGTPMKSPGEVQFTVSDEDTIDAVVADLLTKEVLAVDIETSHLNPRTERILCIGFAVAKNLVVIVPERFVDKLKPVFESDTVFIWHNGKYDTSFLRENGIGARVDEDTMLMSYALSETGSHALKDVAADLIGAGDWKEALKPYIKNKNSSFSDIPVDVLYPYLAEDCDNTLQIYEIMKQRLQSPKEEGSRWAYENIMIPAANFLRSVEHHGMFIDREYIDRLEGILKLSVEDLRRKLHELAGQEFNPASPKQLMPMLHRQGMMVKSTDQRELSKYRNEFVTTQLLFRKESKALGTYVEGMKRRIEADGRVHSTYGLTSTVTGRLSSSAPNLQNITSRAGDPDNRIKRLFIAPPGRMLIECDFSQAELRMLAVLSGDQFLHEVYLGGRDLHTEVAIALFGEGFTPAQRTFAKTINFGIVYGLQSYGLSAQIGCSIDEAQRMIDAWFERAPQAHAYLMRLRRCVRTQGYVQSPFGRKRRFPFVTADILHSLENEASNHPISSAASDINLIAAMQMQDYLADHGAYTINLVHDSNVIECPEELVEDVARYAIETMQEVPRILLKSSITFTADCKVGPNWAQMRSLAV